IVAVTGGRLGGATRGLSQLASTAVVRTIRSRFRVDRTIVGCTRGRGVSVVIMNGRGRNFLSAIFLNDMTDSIVHGSPIPILIIPIAGRRS
ncbi:universal stress protein, partial [Akkermansia biwaensis]